MPHASKSNALKDLLNAPLWHRVRLNRDFALGLQFALNFRLNDFCIWNCSVLDLFKCAGDKCLEAFDLIDLNVISNELLSSVGRIREDPVPANVEVMFSLLGEELSAGIVP